MKKVKCKKCGSDNLLITGQLNPNDDNTIREYFSDAYASAGGSGFCCDCGDVRDFEVVDDVHDGNANDPWRCRNCGSLSVQQRAWVDVNTREIDNFIDGGRDDYWCETCEKHNQLVRESELLNEADHWFENGLKPGQDEIISGLDREDYNSEEEWNAECKALWDARDNESKIDIWHELTRDKSNNKEY